MKRLIFLICVTLSVIACEKEELAVAPPKELATVAPTDTVGNEVIIPKGSNVIRTVNLQSDYSQQLWFDLGTNEVIQSNNRTAWDIAFSCDASNNIVYLNTSNISSAAISNETDFGALTSKSGLNFNYDVPSMNEDSLAIGDVSSQDKVIVIDRGYSPSNKELGLWKLKFTNVSNHSYQLEFGKLNESSGAIVTINKDPLKARLAFSFSQASLVDIEPLKEKFDLVFTQYTEIFYEPQYMPYSVNGVLLNTYQTQGVRVFNKKYEEIDLEYARSKFYISKNDVVGYDWKIFDLNGGSYTIHSDKNYIIKDAAGNYYKLHFLDFYDENGVKGAPSFEYERL